MCNFIQIMSSGEQFEDYGATVILVALRLKCAANFD